MVPYQTSPTETRRPSACFGGRLLLVSGESSTAREEVVAIGPEDRLLEFFSGHLHGVEETVLDCNRISINGRADATQLRSIPTFVDGFIVCDMGRLALSLCGVTAVHYSNRTGLIQCGLGMDVALGLTLHDLRYALATSSAMFKHQNGPNGAKVYMEMSRKFGRPPTQGSSSTGCPTNPERTCNNNSETQSTIVPPPPSKEDWIQRESRTRNRTKLIRTLLGEVDT